MISQLEFASAAAIAGLAAAAIHGTFTPRSSFWGKVLWRAPDISRPQVSLTFDDGPTPGFTDRILDVLGEAQVPAAFFPIGRNALRWPDLLRRMDAEGHVVANHSFDHAHLALFRGWRYWDRELARSDQVIADVIGKRPAIFRPPIGFTTHPIHWAARRSGHTVVTWSRRARDGLRTGSEAIVRRMAAARPGDILMLHDGVDPHLRGKRDRDRSATITALRPLLRLLRDRGLSVVRLDQLLGVAPYAVKTSRPVSVAAAR
jgi:peptidoglycan-N-acetylglucosamine deacetylase